MPKFITFIETNIAGNIIKLFNVLTNDYTLANKTYAIVTEATLNEINNNLKAKTTWHLTFINDTSTSTN